MIIDDSLARAHLLIQHKKYDEAERLLKDLLTANPNNVGLLAMFAEVALVQDKNAVAESAIDNAIGLDPENDYLSYVKARVCIAKKAFDDAEKYIDQAITLDPFDADYFGLWASIKITRKQFEKALELAERALEIDPENLLALNMRSTALLKLGRNDDAFQTIEGALSHDPDNAYTHSNYGWSLLEAGNNAAALNHFREALRTNPNHEHARYGMIEALKASNFLYRWFLKYSFWISNKTAKNQWAIIIGFYLVTRLLNSLSRSNPTLEPYLFPVVIFLSLIAFSTWIIGPVSNLMFKLHPFGRHLLDKDDSLAANFVGICAGVFLAGILGYLIASDERMLAIAVFGFSMMLPCGTMFAETKVKNIFLYYTILMAALGIVAISKPFSTGNLTNSFSLLYLVSFVAFQWVANYFSIRESNY